MPFQIEPKAGPTLTQPTGAMSSAMERAKAAFNSANPVPNPTNVSPEEMTAVGNTKAPEDEETISADTSADATPPPAEEAKAEEPISSQYAVLARKEKAIRQREAQLRQREQAIKAAEDARNAPPAAPAFDPSKYVSKEDLLKDPFGILGNNGLSYDQLTERLLNAPSPEQLKQQEYTRKLEARLEALESGQEKVTKTFEQREQEARKQAVTQIKNEVKKLVITDPAFETIKETNSYNDVVELIEQTFDKDGVLLTVEEAAQQVEDYLMEEAMKLAKIKKIQQRLMPKESPSQASSKPASQQQLKTLTNSVGSTRQLTSKERAILAFKGETKK